MTAYLATFSDGSTKSLKNSKAAYAVAWRIVTQEPGFDPIVRTGFARDVEAAEKASRTEANRFCKVTRWTPKGAALLSSEIVPTVAS